MLISLTPSPGRKEAGADEEPDAGYGGNADVSRAFWEIRTGMAEGKGAANSGRQTTGKRSSVPQIHENAFRSSGRPISRHAPLISTARNLLPPSIICSTALVNSYSPRGDNGTRSISSNTP